MKQPVEGHPNLYKDTESGVIVNRETTERARYRLARDQARMNQQNSLDLQELRDEMDEIKSLLKQMLNK
tara:strand:+ start:466 stop:672 length:207 start_codon:yes stop_codon:yes gene_type:complete